MDQLYFEDGYYEGKYFVYTASAIAGFTPYIDAGYLDQDFFEDKSGAFTLTCEITRVRFIEFDAALAVAFEQTTTANKDARTTVTLSTIADVSAQALKLVPLSSSVSVVATQTSLAQKTARAQAIWTSAFSPTITANASVDPGSDITATFSLTALTGAIKRISIGSGIGVDATSEPNSTASPFLRFGYSDTPTPLDGSVSVSNSVNQTGKFIISMWMVKPIGYVFDADPNRTLYTASGSIGQNNRNNSIQIETLSDAPFFRYRGNTGYVEWPLGPAPRTETLANYSHYLLSVDITKSTNAQKYRLFKDGVEITGGEVHSLGGVGAGQVDTVRTDPYDIKITAFDQYQLMMNTSGAPLHPDARDGQGGGYGDSNGVKDNRSGLTQFWWDYDAASYDIDNSDYRAKFYNGNYLDLGDQGTATGLSRPKHYVRLLNFQDIEEGGTKRSIQTQWNWQKLRVDSSEGTFPVIDYLIAENYTATTDQNSTGILQGIRAAFSLTVETVTVLETTSNPSAAFTVNATVGYGVDIELELPVVSTLVASANKFASTPAAFSSNFTQDTVYQRVRYADSTLASTTTLVSEIIRVQPAGATLTAATTVTAQADDRTRDQTAALNSEFTVSAEIDDRTRDAILLQMGAFTLEATPFVILPFGANLTSTSTLTVNVDVVTEVVLELNTRFTFGSTVFRVLIGEAYLQVTGFQLTEGTVINFDPCREIRVAPETRLARVRPESRLLSVEDETRTLRVGQETRILTALAETRVNILQCQG